MIDTAASSINRNNIYRVLFVRGLRAFADGYVSLLLPVYLISLGMSVFQVGVIASATLFGSGALTLLVGIQSHRFGLRVLLILAAILMGATGLGFALLSSFWPLLLVAFVGTLNPSSGDVSIFLPLEHAVISNYAGDDKRTHVFAQYSLVGALPAAIGALFVALPDYMVAHEHANRITIMQWMFLAYGAIGLTSALIYRGLPGESVSTSSTSGVKLTKAKIVVYTLALLFSLDAFSGGLVLQPMVALWMWQRFHFPITAAGQVFCIAGILSAFSYFVAVWIAKRIGLVNTMIWTHLPASIFLLLIPFVPNVQWAVLLLLLRGALSQMDIPTRSSYVMAVVPPEERAAAASITSVPRSLASAMGPVLTGYLFGLSSFGWPLVAAGGLKILYNVLLIGRFDDIRPPEEKS